MSLAERRARAAGALACGASTGAALRQVGLETRGRSVHSRCRDVVLGDDVVATGLLVPQEINAWIAGDDAASEVS